MLGQFSKKCRICGQEVGRWMMVRHNKESHPRYWRLRVRLVLVRGAVTSIAAVIMLFLIQDRGVWESGLLLTAYIPLFFVVVTSTWILVEWVLAKVARDMKKEFKPF